MYIKKIILIIKYYEYPKIKNAVEHYFNLQKKNINTSKYDIFKIYEINYFNFIEYYSFFCKFCKIMSILIIILIIYLNISLKYNLFSDLHINLINKIFFINENEKEIGSLEDFFFLYTALINAVFFFILMQINILYWNYLNINWIYLYVLFICYLILTIPLNFFLDLKINFFNYIKGSSNTSNFLIEIIFDIIAITVILLRFIIQNIRFIFIFLTLFELFEWINKINYQFFFLNYCFNIDNFNENINLFIVNLILNIIYYLYYSLHLIAILFIQFSIYILISIWLFFFLYISIFLNKKEKFFYYKKFF